MPYLDTYSLTFAELGTIELGVTGDTRTEGDTRYERVVVKGREGEILWVAAYLLEDGTLHGDWDLVNERDARELGLV